MVVGTLRGFVVRVVVGTSVVVVVGISTGLVVVVVVGACLVVVVVVVVVNPVGSDTANLGVREPGVVTTLPFLAVVVVVVVVVVYVLLVGAATVVVVEGAITAMWGSFITDVVVVTAARGGCENDGGPPPRKRTITDAVRATTIATAKICHGVHPAGLARCTMRPWSFSRSPSSSMLSPSVWGSLRHNRQIPAGARLYGIGR